MTQTQLKEKLDAPLEYKHSESMERYQKLLDRIIENSKQEKDSSKTDDETPSPDEQKAVATVMEQAKTPEQERDFLREVDPRNNTDYFLSKYTPWARDNAHTYTNLASIRSKVSYWIGTTLFANPADKNLPDYVWYAPKDRVQVFSGHFDVANYNKNDKNILYTNRRIYDLRDEMQKRIAFWFLIFGLAFGGFSWTATKLHNGYNYVANKVHDGYAYSANKISANGDNEKFKEQQLKNLEADAISLFEDYKAKKITDDQFLARKKELVEREKEIKKN